MINTFLFSTRRTTSGKNYWESSNRVVGGQFCIVLGEEEPEIQNDILITIRIHWARQ